MTEFIRENGERAGVRTPDLLIKSQLLYRLSYALPEEQIVPGSAAEHKGEFSNGQHHKITFLQHKFKKSCQLHIIQHHREMRGVSISAS